MTSRERPDSSPRDILSSLHFTRHHGREQLILRSKRVFTHAVRVNSERGGDVAVAEYCLNGFGVRTLLIAATGLLVSEYVITPAKPKHQR